jgi:hypothetical protein
MKAATLMIAVLVSGIIAADAQDAKSPYAGQESRSIKSLSPEEVRGLLDGGGMGFAKAAELNGSVDEIGVLQGELRAVHLEAHLAQAHILTAQQTALYRELRGYGSSNATHDRAHSH